MIPFIHILMQLSIPIHILSLVNYNILYWLDDLSTISSVVEVTGCFDRLASNAREPLASVWPAGGKKRKRWLVHIQVLCGI